MFNHPQRNIMLQRIYQTFLMLTLIALPPSSFIRDSIVLETSIHEQSSTTNVNSKMKYNNFVECFNGHDNDDDDASKDDDKLHQTYFKHIPRVGGGEVSMTKTTSNDEFSNSNIKEGKGGLRARLRRTRKKFVNIKSQEDGLRVVVAQQGSTVYLGCQFDPKDVKNTTVSWLKREFESYSATSTTNRLEKMDMDTKKLHSHKHENIFNIESVKKGERKMKKAITASTPHLITFGLVTYSRDTRFNVFHQQLSNWDLQIRLVKKSDEGVYECLVPTKPPIKQRIKLQVVVPIIRIVDEMGRPVTEKYYKRGSTIELRCIVRQLVTTQKASQVVELSSKLSVNSIRNQQSKDSIKRYKSSGRIKKHNDMKLDDDGSNHQPMGNSTMGSSLEEQASLAKPRIMWSHQSRILNFDTQRGGIRVRTNVGASSAASKLWISKATRSDSGNYTCSMDQVATSVAVITLENDHPAAMQTSDATIVICNIQLIFLLLLCIIATSQM